MKVVPAAPDSRRYADRLWPDLDRLGAEPGVTVSIMD